MIRARAAAVDDLKTTVLTMRDGDDEFFERIRGHVSGAGAGHEEATGLDELESELVEIVILGMAGFVLDRKSVV